jgi:hypothetical protein
MYGHQFASLLLRRNALVDDSFLRVVITVIIVVAVIVVVAISHQLRLLPVLARTRLIVGCTSCNSSSLTTAAPAATSAHDACVSDRVTLLTFNLLFLGSPTAPAASPP